MIVRGSVLLLACPDCGAQNPHFQYSGDTDMVTEGLSSAGDSEASRLALFRTVPGGSGLDADLRSARLAGTIQHGPSAAGLDFQTFRKLYLRPGLKFHCPWCDAAEMTVSREMTPAEFVDAGGRIDCIGAIELPEGQPSS